MARLLTSVLLVAVMVGVAGCNTLAGFGQDLQHAGAALEGAASP